MKIIKSSAERVNSHKLNDCRDSIVKDQETITYFRLGTKLTISR